MKSIAFVAVFGLFPGYENNDGWQPVEPSVPTARVMWQAIMEKELEATKTFVSAVVTESYTIYPRTYGCPNSGEKTISVFGEMNPEFEKDSEKYKEAVIRCCQALKNELKQTTVRISFYETDSVYLKG